MEAAAELSAKVRAGPAAARPPHAPRAPRSRAPQAAPDGRKLLARVQGPGGPRSALPPRPSLALPAPLRAARASAL